MKSKEYANLDFFGQIHVIVVWKIIIVIFINLYWIFILIYQNKLVSLLPIFSYFSHIHWDYSYIII